MNVYNIPENKIPPREFQIIIKPGKVVTKDGVSGPANYIAYLMHEIGMVYAGEAFTVEALKPMVHKFINDEFAGKEGEVPITMEEIEFSEQHAEPTKAGRKQ